jgi:hypothetical protein
MGHLFFTVARGFFFRPQPIFTVGSMSLVLLWWNCIECGQGM